MNQSCNEIHIQREKVNSHLPTVIIGAGPVGLAAAAHLAQLNQTFIIIEEGSQVGANIKKWQHIRLFSPWRYNIDKVARKVLKAEGWLEPDLETLPTGEALINQYLLPLSESVLIKPYLKLSTKVLSISKKNIDKMKTNFREKAPFVLHVRHKGVINKIEARAVIDATGTWGNPNPANSEGVWLQEKNITDYTVYGLPDILGKDMNRYKNKSVAVVGSGHSAINMLLHLSELQKKYKETKINWIIRKSKVEETYGGKEKDALAARGVLGSKINKLVNAGNLKVESAFKIEHMKKNADDKIEIKGEQNAHVKVIASIDQVIVNTGNRPDFSFLREVRYKIDFATESVEALAPLIDPNIHSCGTVRPHGEKELRQPDENFYIVGAKSYGRAPTFLMATGYEQVRSVVSYLAGNYEAAKKVELDLPETGVCNVHPNPALKLTEVKVENSCKNSISNCSF